VSIISRLFGRFQPDDPGPWTDESIYRLISSHIDPQSGLLIPKDLRLHDEPIEPGSKTNWAPGALE